MCNLYSLKTPRSAIREAFGVAATTDRTGNQPPLLGNFSDQMAPIVRVEDGSRMMRRPAGGIPGPMA